MIHFFDIDPLQNIFGHGNGLAGLKAFEEFLLNALLLKALQVLTDEPMDLVTRRAVMGSEAALFDELFEELRERDG